VCLNRHRFILVDDLVFMDIIVPQSVDFPQRLNLTLNVIVSHLRGEVALTMLFVKVSALLDIFSVKNFTFFFILINPLLILLLPIL
jgi:hypothetical protein